MLEFNDRQRDVWGRYYTELFFLDEVTAFAAGHRPCFECRRKDAEHFAALFPGKQRASAAAMDDVLHAERLDGKAKAPAPARHRYTAGRRHDRARRRGLCRARRASAALDAAGYAEPRAAPARHRGRCAHAAVDPCRAQAPATAALASERATRYVTAARSAAWPARPARGGAQPKNTIAAMTTSIADHQRDAGRPAAERPGEAAERRAEAAADIEAGDVEPDRRRAAGLGGDGHIAGRDRLADQPAAGADGEARE